MFRTRKLHERLSLQNKLLKEFCSVSTHFEGLNDLCKAAIYMHRGAPGPPPGVDVTFQAKSPLFIQDRYNLHPNKAACDFHMRHSTDYHVIVIRVILIGGN